MDIKNLVNTSTTELSLPPVDKVPIKKNKKLKTDSDNPVKAAKKVLPPRGEDPLPYLSDSDGVFEDMPPRSRKLPQQLPPIPKYWLACPRKGRKLQNAPFVACKVFLDSRFDSIVDEESRWHDTMLNTLQIAACIDLCLVDTYYQVSSASRAINAPIVKLPCDEGSVPSADIVARFIVLCKQFLAQDSSRVIVVMDTLGFNVAGYLICCYLCDHMDWSVEAALSTFAASRSPGIFKVEFIDALFARYDETRPPTFAIPSAPQWIGPKEGVAALGVYRPKHFVATQSAKLQHVKLNYDKSYVETRLDVLYEPYVPMASSKSSARQALPEPMFLDSKIDGEYPPLGIPIYGNIADALKDKVLSWLQMSEFPNLNDVSQLTVSTAQNLDWHHTFITWRPDGMRLLLMVDEGKTYMVNSNWKFSHLSETRFELKSSIIAGEYVQDKLPKGVIVQRFLISDILLFENSPKAELGTLDERLAKFEKDVIALRKGKLYDSESLRIRPKLLLPASTGFPKLIDSILPSLPHGHLSILVIDCSEAEQKCYEWFYNDMRAMSRGLLLSYIS